MSRSDSDGFRGHVTPVHACTPDTLLTGASIQEASAQEASAQEASVQEASV